MEAEFQRYEFWARIRAPWRPERKLVTDCLVESLYYG
jgi:hypothetical protein